MRTRSLFRLVHRISPTRFQSSMIKFDLQWPLICRPYCSSTSSFHKIGMREVVGFGMNGRPDYIESVTFPYPAIRFREITPEFKALKEKEKGSWKILTINEKKCLYRISYCCTLTEIDAPTGEWKTIIGSTLIFISLAIWFHIFIIFMIRDELPESFSSESQVAQLKRMLDLKMNPIDGISSKWDYENNTWKGKGRPDKKKKSSSEDKDQKSG